MRPGKVAAIMQQTADSQPCPTETPASGAPGSAAGGCARPGHHADQRRSETCQGGEGHNSWYGSGQINALSAVTK